MSAIYVKSPFNWIGNKYQIMKQLMPLFPQKIDTLIDFFCGGCDISINATANKKIAVDANSFLIEIMQAFQQYSFSEILNFIEKRIDEFKLSKENEDGFLAYRDAYNNIPEYHTPLDLYTLTRFSFHFTMRFNKNLQFNAGFGRGYSNFSARQRNSIEKFYNLIQGVELHNASFSQIDLTSFNPNNTLLYFDPPYLITNQVYNNGLPEVWQKWDEYDEKELLNYLDNAHNLGFKWALSNVIEHHGKTNTILAQWIDGYEGNLFVHDINNPAYSHCTHTVNDGGNKTREIVVTNYEI